MKPFTTRELADQLRAQGRVILMLVAEREARSKVEKANNIARVVSNHARADMPETSRDQLYGDLVREPTEIEKLRIEMRNHVGTQIERLRDELNADRPEPSEDTEEMWLHDDEAAASCHLVADVLEARGGVAPEHLSNLRRAAKRLRHEA